MWEQSAQRLIQLAADVFTELRYIGDLLRHTLTMLAAAAYWGPHPGRPDRPAVDADRHAHPRPAAHTTLTARRGLPRVSPGRFPVPRSCRHHAEDGVTIPTARSPEPRRSASSIGKPSDGIVCILSAEQHAIVLYLYIGQFLSKDHTATTLAELFITRSPPTRSRR